jgi:hypothetical protein
MRMITSTHPLCKHRQGTIDCHDPLVPRLLASGVHHYSDFVSKDVTQYNSKNLVSALNRKWQNFTSCMYSIGSSDAPIMISFPLTARLANTELKAFPPGYRLVTSVPYLPLSLLYHLTAQCVVHDTIMSISVLLQWL